MNYDKLTETLRQHGVSCVRAHGRYCSICDEAATALSTLQAENEKLRAELSQMAACVYYKPGGLCRYGGDDPANVCVLGPCPHERTAEEVLADLARVTAERDAAVKAVKNMAEYIVCAGRVDYFLCDEISQEHHLKYQPKNDGNYNNEPCYKCIADWFLQGHEWQENC